MVQYRITKNRGTGKYRLEFKSGNDYLVCTDYELMKSEFIRDTLEECQLERYKREKEDNDNTWDEVDISGSIYKNPNDKQGYSSKYDSKDNIRPHTCEPPTVEYPKGVR